MIKVIIIVIIFLKFLVGQTMIKYKIKQIDLTPIII